MSRPRRRGSLLAAVGAAALAVCTSASAGTIIAPSSASTAEIELFTLAV